MHVFVGDMNHCCPSIMIRVQGKLILIQSESDLIRPGSVHQELINSVYNKYSWHCLNICVLRAYLAHGSYSLLRGWRIQVVHTHTDGCAIDQSI